MLYYLYYTIIYERHRVITELLMITGAQQELAEEMLKYIKN